MTFFYHFSNPWSYLAASRTTTSAILNRSTVEWRPFLPSRQEAVMWTSSNAAKDAVVDFKRALSLASDLPPLRLWVDTSNHAGLAGLADHADLAGLADRGDDHDDRNNRQHPNHHTDTTTVRLAAGMNVNDEIMAQHLTPYRQRTHALPAMALAAALLDRDPHAAQHFAQVMLAGIYAKSFNPDDVTTSLTLMRQVSDGWSPRAQEFVRLVNNDPQRIVREGCRLLVQQSRTWEKDLGIRLTPTLMVDGQRWVGFWPLLALDSWLEIRRRKPFANDNP